MESFVDAWNGLWVPCEERRTALWTAVVVAIGKLRPLREILADWKIARFGGIVLRKLVGALTTRPGTVSYTHLDVYKRQSPWTATTTVLRLRNCA